MAGLNIGDVFMRVAADMTGFEADVTKGAKKAGDQAGRTLGQRLKLGMTAGFSAVGAGAGLVFGAAARGAAELTDAMAAFQAETGATQQELDSARKSVLELSKTNLHSFDEIAKAQAALRTQMGLTQEQAEASTDAFLKFSTATGQEASAAVASFDDVLDSWGLTAENAEGLMDQLIVSHQKYGGVIADNQKTLAALAPSMKAANFEIDDGIALLNLFGAKGIDAITASAAFSKALTKVESPEQLKELIADISATEDPFLRAEKAADLFGARAGAKLANALAGANLDDFKVGMDEAAGATERAAEAIEKTPLNQLKMALRSIAAPAIEAGQAFGPLLLALSQLGGGRLVAAVTSGLGGLAGALTAKLGPRMADGLTKMLGKLVIPASALAGPLEEGISGGLEQAARSPKVGRAGGKLGEFLGSKLGKGLSIAFAAVAVFEVLETYNRIKGELAAQTEQIGADIATSLATGSTDQLKRERAAVLQGLNDLYRFQDFGILTGDTKNALMAQLNTIDAELAKRASGAGSAVENLGPKIGTRMALGADSVRAGAETMAAPIPGEVEDASTDAVAAASAMPGQIGAAILERQGLVSSAMAALKAQASGELMGWQQTARTIGQLVSTEVANGITDKRPGVRLAAENVRNIGEAELRKHIAAGFKIGQASIDQLNAGLKSKDPAVRAQARRTLDIIKNTKPNTAPVGRAAGQGVVTGLNSQSGPIGNAAARLARRIAQSMVDAIAVHGRGERTGRAGGGAVQPPGMAGGGDPVVPFAYRINEKGEELFVPSVRGRVLTAAEARTIASTRAHDGGGDTTNVNLSTYGLPMQASTPADVAMALRRVGTMGLLQRPRKTSWSRS